MLPIDLIYFLAAVGLVVFLGIRGYLRPSALACGPERSIGMGWFDLGIAIWLFFVGGLLAVGVSFVYFASLGVKDTEQVSEVQQMLMNLITQLAMWGPAVLYLFIRVGFLKQFKLAGLVPLRPLRDLGVALLAVPAMVLLAMGVLFAFLFIYLQFGGALPKDGHELIGVLKETQSTTVIVLLIFSAVIVAPITEELFFRGLVQTALLATIGPKYRWTAILIAALFFGVIHAAVVPAIMLPSLVMVGVVLGWVYERTGSLLCCILTHAGFNAFSIGITLLAV